MQLQKCFIVFETGHLHKNVKMSSYDMVVSKNRETPILTPNIVLTLGTPKQE